MDKDLVSWGIRSSSHQWVDFDRIETEKKESSTKTRSYNARENNKQAPRLNLDIYFFQNTAPYYAQAQQLMHVWGPS